MATELLPVVDLRALSQPDLDALAAASAHALAPRTCHEADPLPPLKIDRAVFNESAGSRKQTFSRRRLGASLSSARHTSSAQSSAGRKIDPESDLVAYHLRRLFVHDDSSLPPPPEPQTLALLQEPSSPPPLPPDPDRETTNAKGVSVDLLKLAGLVDPYDAELHRRTAGMASDTELQGFIDSLAGKWVSQRQRRKYVDASFFGDHLPRGWKLQLGLKRKGGSIWLRCFSYVSPKGSHFSTCKDVSAYLMALLGYPELKPATNKYESTGQPYSSANDGDDSALCFQDQIGSIMDKTNAQHHLAYHEMSVKRRRTGKFGEPVVGKDGKFECPICHKTFEEEPQYFGHVGSHARYEGLAPEAFLDKATSRRAANDSLAEIPFSLQELTESHGQNNKVSYGEKGFQHHNHSNKHGDNNLTAIDLFGTNYSDNFIRPNKTWGSPEEGPSCNDAPSVSRYTNFTGHADVIVSERASISNNQSVSNINGFIFSDQPGGNHVVRPTASADNNTVKARDVNLNSCASASTISFPIAYANNETSAALNEANRSSSTAKCFSGSFNNNDGACSASSSCGPTNKISSSFGTSSKTQAAGSRSIGASYEPYGEDCSALKANPFASKNNTSVYQYNLATQPVYAVAARADCFASGSEQTKNSDKELASSAKQRIDNVENRTSKEAGFVAEAYNSGAFNGGITEKGFAQISNSFTHIKSNASGSCSLPESKTPTNGSDSNCIKGSLVNRGDDSFTKVSIVNRPINNNESNVARLEAMGKLNDEMQNRYNYHAPGIDPHVAASASRNANGFMPMQANFGCMSSTVQSVVDVSVSSTSQDQKQCDLQLGFGAQKQQIFSNHGELRTATPGSPLPGSIARKDSVPTEPSHFGSMNGPKSFPTGTSQFGGFAKPTFVPAAPSQFGSMAQANYVHSAQSSQFTSWVQPNSIPPAESSQFGSKAQSSSVPPANTSQFRGMAGQNSVPPAQSFGSTVRPNYVTPESSQFGSMARPNSVPPQYVNMPSQNFVSSSEPTLVLGYAPQIGSGPPPQVQLGWDLSLPRMVTGGSMVTCLCIWCNSQFHHFGPVDGQQPSSFGFICPTCKDRMSGHHSVPNNGSWQP
ncbi:Methyl-CpG-binding domain-containing protein 8 [Zea mays]|uniref:Methyl-CpG-binding domain-containing protein 8 n=2 Tax=Zea mays TaxID=4577 RepID=A0A1D6KHV7_MAIZE|nr:Methyl-CpG-binding domain-containing protein 8 [Zea mays]